MKVPGLKALTPTQSEPPFQIIQLVFLLVFLVFTVAAAKKIARTACTPLDRKNTFSEKRL
jgi:hypothetical protein